MYGAAVDVLLCVLCVLCEEQQSVFVQPSFRRQLLHKRPSVAKDYLLPTFKVTYMKYMTRS